MDIHAALNLYNPGAIYSTVRMNEGWEDFDGLGVGEWDGDRPQPSAADLITAMDGRNLTTIQHWATAGSLAQRSRFGIPYLTDYLTVRARIKALMDVAGGFELLPIEDQTICATFFLGSPQQRALFFGSNPALMAASSLFRERTKEARRKRYELAQLLIFNTVVAPGYIDILIAMGQDLADKYIDLNLLGTANQDPIPGILDFLLGTEDTQFESHGFLDVAFTPIRITKEEIRNAIVSILTDG